MPPKVPKCMRTHTPPYKGECALVHLCACAGTVRQPPEALAKRYLDGMTLREIGREIGRSHTAVRYQLRKVTGYRAMVTRMLLQRIRDAKLAYSLTRTHEKRRRLKHALAMLRRNRPALFARWIARQGPRLPGAMPFGREYRADCPECRSTRAVWARKRSRRWEWVCTVCERSGAVRAS